MKKRLRGVLLGVVIGAMSMFIVTGCTNSNNVSQAASNKKTTLDDLVVQGKDLRIGLITDKKTDVEYLVVQNDGSKGGISVIPLIDYDGQPELKRHR